MTRTPAEVEAFYASVLAIPAHRTYGLSLIRWEAGEAELAFTADEPCFGPEGEVHGGVLSLLLEPTAMFALFPMLPADRYAVTADIHVQFLKPAKPRTQVRLMGRVMRLGKQLAFVNATATVSDALCASAQITKSIVTKSG